MSTMHSGTNVDVEVDRLSSLPDDLIYKILSVLSVRNNRIGVSSVSLNLAVDDPKLSVERILGSVLAKCQNLKNLTLERCEVSRSDGFTIINSRLLSLTLKKVEWKYMSFVNVDTPQLKNFIFVDSPQWEEDYIREAEKEYYYRTIIGEFSGELTISAPGLTYLRIKGSYFPKLSVDGFPSLEKVDLCISSPRKTDVHKILGLFQRLHNVKSLALSLEIESQAMKIKLSPEVTNYLLDSSSNATFTMVSYEEARAIKITKVAYRLMAALWEILEKMVAYTETKRVNVESRKTLADSCREDFRMRIGPRGDNEVIFCILENIKLLLTKWLASKRVKDASIVFRD
ncbi:hypothetical protein Tco_0992108 [Tanacetum coccineum]|uniref:F-box domain-containing protein n=1 Tax=Tanacetum coccineum TaxID=301880 RepID=A0ABQ5F1X7_9ASTR